MALKKPQNTNPDGKDGSGSKSPSKKKMTPEEQSAQFIKTARKLGSDETGKAFDKAFKKISSAPPPQSNKSP